MDSLDICKVQAIRISKENNVEPNFQVNVLIYYCKKIIVCEYFDFAVLAVNQTLPKYETAKYSFELSYTISYNLTHTLSMSVSVLSKKHLWNCRVCFIVEKKHIFKGATVKEMNMLPRGSIF